MIRPVIFFSLVIGVIYGFQYFTEAYVAASAVGGTSGTRLSGIPRGRLLFYTIYLYQQGFTCFHLGYASAMAWILFLITMVCTLGDQGLEALGLLPRGVPVAAAAAPSDVRLPDGGVRDRTPARAGRRRRRQVC